MANNAKQNGPFDVKTVEALVALMSQHDLSEIYLREGSQHMRLRRGTAIVAPAASVPAPQAAPAMHQSAAPVLLAAKPETAPSARNNLIEIKSETVGTFYAQPKPGEPAYVKLGDRVTPTKVVGLVEVMKTYNEIQANCTGVVVDILVENGKYVEFAEVLFRIDPS